MVPPGVVRGVLVVVSLSVVRELRVPWLDADIAFCVVVMLLQTSLR